MKRIVAMAIVLITFLSLTVNVLADNNFVEVLVNTEIDFEVNGVEFIPRETDGTKVYPLSFKDRTYIPARFIAEAVGLEVTWDEATQTVGFISKNTVPNTNMSYDSGILPEKFYVNAILNQDIKFEFDGEAFVPKEADGTILYPLVYKDRTYIPARFIMERAGIEVTWDEATQTVGFNTKTANLSAINDNPLLSDEPVGIGKFKSLKDLNLHIENERIITIGDTSNGAMTPSERTAFREKALKGMILFGFEYVAYNDYNHVLETFPSYAEVYSYYMKNARGMSDAKILEHLTTVYSNPLDAIKLTPVTEHLSEADMHQLSIGFALYDTEKDTNQNNLYILRHMDFRKISEIRSVVIKNTNSAYLLLESSDLGSYFAFKSNKLDDSYLEMFKYYIKNKIGGDFAENGVMLPNHRIVVGTNYDSFLVRMQ